MGVKECGVGGLGSSGRAHMNPNTYTFVLSSDLQDFCVCVCVLCALGHIVLMSDTACFSLRSTRYHKGYDLHMFTNAARQLRWSLPIFFFVLLLAHQGTHYQRPSSVRPLPSPLPHLVSLFLTPAIYLTHFTPFYHHVQTNHEPQDPKSCPGP